MIVWSLSLQDSLSPCVLFPHPLPPADTYLSLCSRCCHGSDSVSPAGSLHRESPFWHSHCWSPLLQKQGAGDNLWVESAQSLPHPLPLGSLPWLLNCDPLGLGSLFHLWCKLPGSHFISDTNVRSKFPPDLKGMSSGWSIASHLLEQFKY